MLFDIHIHMYVSTFTVILVCLNCWKACVYIDSLSCKGKGVKRATSANNLEVLQKWGIKASNKIRKMNK